MLDEYNLLSFTVVGGRIGINKIKSRNLSWYGAVYRDVRDVTRRYLSSLSADNGY